MSRPVFRRTTREKPIPFFLFLSRFRFFSRDRRVGEKMRKEKRLTTTNRTQQNSLRAGSNVHRKSSLPSKQWIITQTGVHSQTTNDDLYLSWVCQKSKKNCLRVTATEKRKTSPPTCMVSGGKWDQFFHGNYYCSTNIEPNSNESQQPMFW